MGGLIAVRMLQKMKLEIAGLILSSPTFALKYTPSKVSHLLSSSLNKVAPEHRFTFGFPIEKATRNEEVIEIDREDSINVTRVSVRWYREILLAMKQMALNKQFPDIPLLLIQGGNDFLADTQVAKKWFLELDLLEMHYKEWPQCYHELFNEPERDEIFAYTESFTRNRLRNIGYDV